MKVTNEGLAMGVFTKHWAKRMNEIAERGSINIKNEGKIYTPEDYPEVGGYEWVLEAMEEYAERLNIEKQKS